ncbi:hypothetical protein Tco_0420965, partial [Tanacetum coccineum]
MKDKPQVSEDKPRVLACIPRESQRYSSGEKHVFRGIDKCIPWVKNLYSDGLTKVFLRYSSGEKLVFREIHKGFVLVFLGFEDGIPQEVIMNGDAPAIASASTEGPIPPKTAEQKLARKNKLKAKGTLLLAIPDEHLLKFHGIKDAKTLWEAIKARSEGLDKTYDRFQKLIIQLDIHGEVISQEDANLKLLRILPSAWNNIALIMLSKADLDELSMDDLYNNLKVYEAEIKIQSSTSSNSQNVDFVSSDDTSSTNEAVNTAHDVPAARSKGQAFSSTYADDVIDGSQMVGGHAYHEGEEILKEDRKESEFQW